MTVGYLLDLFIINEVRKEKLAAQLDGDVKNDLNRQNGYLLREIGRYILEISDTIEGSSVGITLSTFILDSSESLKRISIAFTFKTSVLNFGFLSECEG